MKNEICVICQSTLHYLPVVGNQDDSAASAASESYKVEARSYSSPECGHAFHGECLRNWIEGNQKTEN